MPDPLTSTLFVLPVVLGGLWAVDRWLRLRGQRRETAAMGAFQLGALLILVLMVLGRRSLGLEAGSPGLDEVLAGGLALLLVIRVSTLVAALMRGFVSGADSRPGWPFFVLPLVVFVAILPWSAGQREPDGDEPYFLLITHSLAFDFDTDLANNYAQQHSLSFMSRALEPSWADPKPVEGRMYSRHGPLFPLILVPAYWLAGKWGAMLTMTLIGAYVAWLSLYLFLHYWGSDRSREAVSVWALVSLTPPVLVYSHQIWIELPAAAILMVGLLTIRDMHERMGGRRQWLILAFLILLLPLLKLRFALLSVSLLVLAWWRSGGSKRALVWLGLALMTAIGGMLLYNQIVFDSPFKDHSLSQLLQIQGRSPLVYLQGVSGLFWDCAFGLVASNPLWLLLVPALAVAVWCRSPALVDVAICVLPYLALVSPRREWYGAWAPPFRFGMVLLPLLAVILVPLLRRRLTAGAKGVLAALGLLAMVLMLLWLVVPGWTYNLAVGTNHLIDHLSIRLAADVGRFFPSMVRLRSASWWVPLFATLVGTLAWWYPRQRPKQVSAWATVLLLLLVAAVPLAAKRVPTRWVEFEDRQVEKQGGKLYPDPWVPYRPQYRGGWELGAGESLRAPIVSGGERLSIRLEVWREGGSPDSVTLEALAGSRALGMWSPGADRRLQTYSLEDLDWPADADLVLVLRATDSPRTSGRVIVDRARLSWK